MPLLLQQHEADFRLALWKIEEPMSYFAFGHLPPKEQESAGIARQRAATRYLANLLAGQAVVIDKDEYGKPIIREGSYQISLSHTAQFAAVILSRNKLVGIDVEAVRPKIERIASRFLHQEEWETVGAEKRAEKLTVYWSAKEALYKLYGKKRINFGAQLQIAPFTLQTEGTLQAAILADKWRKTPLNLTYRFFDKHVLTYVLGR